MPEYQFYITDSRYSGQRVELHVVADALRAQEIAAVLMAEAPRFLKIDIFTGGFQIPTIA